MVVYRSIPTSNRNLQSIVWIIACVVYRSIPTSNRNENKALKAIIELYIVLFLHQTATVAGLHGFHTCCISFYSYIKPQHGNH